MNQVIFENTNIAQTPLLIKPPMSGSDSLLRKNPSTFKEFSIFLFYTGRFPKYSYMYIVQAAPVGDLWKRAVTYGEIPVLVIPRVGGEG